MVYIYIYIYTPNKVDPKIFGALGETIKLCPFNYCNSFLKIYSQYN